MCLEDLIPCVIFEECKNEFKIILEEGKSISSSKSIEIEWLKDLIAFANTEGGTLYVGVDNKTHKIISLDHDTVDKITLMIHGKIKQRIEPKIKYRITSIPIKEESETRYVLKIDVEKNELLPVTLREDNLLGIYTRHYGNSILASFEEIREMVLLSDNVPFDKAFTTTEYKKEDFKVLNHLYRERTNTDLTEKALISIGFMNQERLLSKGAILFSDDYSEQRTKIVCTLWPGITKGRGILATEEFSGNILDSIDFAISFIQNHSTNGFIKEDIGRREYFSYPPRSITLGIVNAFAHRNYFIAGSQIEVNLFKDRLEITSPGTLLGVASLNKEKNISSIIPRRRNEVICSILEYCRYMESKGSGFDKIEQDYIGKGENFKPFISSNSTSFTLVLPNLTSTDGVIDEDSVPTVGVEGVLEGKNDLTILSFCFSKPRSAKEIADYIGLKPSTYFRKEVLGKLINQDYLKEDKTQSVSMYLANPSKVFVQ